MKGGGVMGERGAWRGPGRERGEVQAARAGESRRRSDVRPPKRSRSAVRAAARGLVRQAGTSLMGRPLGRRYARQRRAPIRARALAAAGRERR